MKTDDFKKNLTRIHKDFNKRCELARKVLPDFDKFVTENDTLVLSAKDFFEIEQLEFAPFYLYMKAHFAI